jgi:hypothetical protein
VPFGTSNCQPTKASLKPSRHEQAVPEVGFRRGYDFRYNRFTQLTKSQSERIGDFTQRLLAYEGVVGDPSGVNNSSAFRASEKLRGSLSILAGIHGYRTLLVRALTLAKRETGSLSTVQVKPDGSLEGLGDLSNDQAAEAGLTLITQLLELLETFVGESLTRMLAHDVWPDFPGDEPDSGKLRSS